MNSTPTEELAAKIARLRRTIAAYGTESMLTMLAMILLRDRESINREYGLTSPVRQCLYLIGLLVGTSYPARPRPFGRTEMTDCCDLLEGIYDTYFHKYFETPPQPNDPSGVALPAFIKFLCEGPLLSSEQIAARINAWAEPFDDFLQEQHGISASLALRVLSWIGDHLQSTMDYQTELTLRMRAAQEAASSSPSSMELHSHACDATEAYISGFQRLFRVTKDALIAEFGDDVANRFWSEFVSRREESGAQGIIYPTSETTFHARPLIETAPGDAICPYFRALELAVMKRILLWLSSGSHREAFLRNRDISLERATKELLSRLFRSAEFLEGVFETPKAQHEHDLIIAYRDRVLVIECKASPPVEPFRDPVRAYQRIKRAFSSDRGIQKAYEQTERIRSRLARKEIVELFDAGGKTVKVLDGAKINKIFAICVTADDFGALAVDLTLLLEKPCELPYPWAVNISDLETLVDAFKYRGWGAMKFCQFIEERIRLHGKAIASDELEIAAPFIRKGSLDELLYADADRLFFRPDVSDVFGEIYSAKHGGPAVRRFGQELAMVDLEGRVGDHLVADQEEKP